MPPENASTYNAIKAGTLPKQFAIGLNSVAWDAAEIKAWQQAQIDAARRTTGQKSTE
ncbi:helix-turn-helix transcriptional regulator [Janthinobacterium sp. NFX145]|uniref:helix-turn-helix transcriptional regulator n=1 Tax=Janthinobacterium sp. NFX145 TaxID=3415602 RepID=UPI003CC65167